MAVCLLCRQEVAPSEARVVHGDGREILVHTSCFDDFAPLVREALATSGVTPPTGLSKLARSVDGRLVLVHRNFKNEQMPFLVYLAGQKDPVAVTEMYSWAEQNELRIHNMANQVLRLKNKGFISTFDREGERVAVITEDGRRAIEEYAASLT
jgi:hypothetical protein